MSEQELTHVGVKGMRWGVRRYQNKDGSLTPAGKKRYITVAQANRNANSAAKDARRASIAADRASGLNGLGSARKAILNANEAAKQAKKESFAADKAHNKQLRAERSASNPNRKREIAIGIGAAAGTALAAYGVYKVSTAIKNKAFKHSMDRGMNVAKRLVENGQSKLALDNLYDTYSHHGDSTISVIRRTISNNEVRGKVDWRNVAKTLMG